MRLKCRGSSCLTVMILMILASTMVGIARQTDFRIEPVKNIGGDRENFSFFSIRGACIAGNRNIYVCDSKKNCVAQYDWNGNFIARAGQKGQGPGDFNLPIHISEYGNQLYIYDAKNLRIAVCKADLRNVKFEYIYLKRTCLNQIHILNERTLIADIPDIEGDLGKIGLFDMDGDLIKSFFSYDQFGNTDKKKTEREWVINSITGMIRMAVDRNNSEIVVTFKNPSNPIAFYIYGFDGKLKRKFIYPLDKKYQFPDHFKSIPFKKLSNPMVFPTVESLFVYKDTYLVFYSLIRSDGDRIETLISKECLVFNHDGNLITKKAIKNDLEFYQLTDDGFLIGRDINDENPVVVIYECEF